MDPQISANPKQNKGNPNEKNLYAYCWGGALLTAFSASALTASPEQMAIFQKRMAESSPYIKADGEVDYYIFCGKNADPKTYAELTKIVEDIYAKHGIKSDDGRVRSKIYQKAFFNYRHFRNDAWKDIVSKNDSIFWKQYFIIHRANGFSDEQTFDALCEILFVQKYMPPPKQAEMIVDTFIKMSVGIDEAKMKDTLKKLNRVFSPNLIKNKSEWEPIVAKIRTALETY